MDISACISGFRRLQRLRIPCPRISFVMVVTSMEPLRILSAVDDVPPNPIISVMRWLANGVYFACLKWILFRCRMCCSTSDGSTIDMNVVLGSLGSAVGSSGTLIMLIPLDMEGRADGTRLNISFEA